MYKRKEIPPSLRPQRRASRRSNKADLLAEVLQVVNGEVRFANRYEPSRSRVREALDRIIEYCDEVEDALAGVNWVADRLGQLHHVPLVRTERISKAVRMAGGLYGVFAGIPNKFTVSVYPKRRESQAASLDMGTEFHGNAIAALTDLGDLPEEEKPNVLPYADELFRITKLFMWPDGDIEVCFLWEFFHGIIQLDDLRKLRKCSGYLHEEPRYFVRKKVERHENCFCSDQCRSDFNYRLKIEGDDHGRKRQTEGR